MGRRSQNSLAKRRQSALASRRPDRAEAVRRGRGNPAGPALPHRLKRPTVGVGAVKVDGPLVLEICPEDVLGGGAPPGAQAAYG